MAPLSNYTCGVRRSFNLLWNLNKPPLEKKEAMPVGRQEPTFNLSGAEGSLFANCPLRTLWCCLGFQDSHLGKVDFGEVRKPWQSVRNALRAFLKEQLHQ